MPRPFSLESRGRPMGRPYQPSGWQLKYAKNE